MVVALAVAGRDKVEVLVVELEEALVVEEEVDWVVAQDMAEALELVVVLVEE